MKIKIYILKIFILSGVIQIYSQYPAINQNRPRIYADTDRLTWLAGNILVPGQCQNTFKDIQYAYNNWWINDPQLYLIGSDSTLWNWDWSSVYSAEQTFLTVTNYKLTNNPLELKRCRYIAGQVINWINNAKFSSMEFYTKENYIRKISDAGDLLLDWCYYNLPPNLRNDLASAIYNMNNEFMNTYIYSSSGTSYVSSHNTWNNIFANQNALTLYNSEGLTNQQKDTVVQWFQKVYDKHINGFIPCWSYYRDDDGGWNWGAAYSMWSLVDQFQLFENMKIGTNKNFYKDLPWVKNSINQYLYFNQPNHRTLHIGDGETELKGDRAIYLHARRFNDPRSLWLAQYWSQPSLTPNTMDKFSKLLYFDFEMPTVSKPDNPLTWFSDKVGMSVSLSSWESDATMLTLYNALSKRAAHEHRDNNSITIFKNKPLLIESGYYDEYQSSHYNNYYSRTIAHNSIVVFDSTDNYLNIGKMVSNDGGQIESTYLLNYNEIFLPQNQRGTWSKCASGDNYSYNVSDAQSSYDQKKLKFFRRKLLHFKSDYIVVLDHIILNDILSNQRDISWIGHFANQPALNGNKISSIVPDHIETFDGKDYLASNGNGNIAIRTLLPENTNVTLIGGAGYEYWVNGKNYPPLVIPDTNYYTPGGWRIEVRPKTITDTIVFLHTINTGDNVKFSEAKGILLRSSISIGADWNDAIFFFSADGSINKSHHILNQVSGDRIVKLFATDLIYGTYDVKIDNLINSKVSTDTNGILQTELVLPVGKHNIELISNSTAINDSGTENVFQVYPNPAQNELIIDLPKETNDCEVEIYNYSGQNIHKSNYEKVMNISCLPKGFYLVRIKLDGNVYFSKFIKG
jgi:hypothetical protein